MFLSFSNFFVFFIVTADFGFARFLEEGKMAGTLCGSPMYMVSLVCLCHCVCVCVCVCVCEHKLSQQFSFNDLYEVLFCHSCISFCVIECVCVCVCVNMCAHMNITCYNTSHIEFFVLSMLQYFHSYH